MRPHGFTEVDPRRPRAKAVCDLCGRTTNHFKLRYQYDWRGPKLQNLYVLRCQWCIDKPQEQLRTIVLPQDPVPINNARPELYVHDDNPISYLGFDPQNMFMPQSQRGANFGNMVHCAGVDAAFNSVTNKRLEFCAALLNSVSSFGNIVGKSWNADPTGATTTRPSTAATVTHTISNATLYAPNDQPFLKTGSTSYRIEGSSNNSTWTTLASGKTVGGTGEILNVTNVTGSDYAYHRLNLAGDGISNIGVAQFIINVSN